MAVTIRRGTTDDARECGRICYEAFHGIAAAHGFPDEIPTVEIAVDLIGHLLDHPGFYGVVAERDGAVVGSNFLDERSPIAGIGPITVEDSDQNSGVGRLLMQAVLDRTAERGFPGVRLVQAAYHNRSFSLYAKLGFEVREPLVTLQGRPIQREVPGYPVRPAKMEDLEACADLCRRVHGHDRTGELRDAVHRGSAAVVEFDGRITGYTTLIGFFGHTVGLTNTDLQALIAAAPMFPGPGFLLPSRNGELLRWCFDQGLRVVHLMTLMTKGLYNEPRGAFLPSISF